MTMREILETEKARVRGIRKSSESDADGAIRLSPARAVAIGGGDCLDAGPGDEGVLRSR